MRRVLDVAVLSLFIVSTPSCASPQRRPTEEVVPSSSSSEVREENRAVVHAFFARLEAFDIRGFSELFAEQGTQIMPFSPEGFPKRLEGRTAIFNQYRGMPDNFASMRFPDLVVHDMVDPSRFFVTYRGEIRLKSGGPYNNTYAALFVIQNGQIAEYYEYFDPIVLQRAFGDALGASYNVGR
ncbi:nuclear transport factor 2 family protein [Sorangium sp. So ce385]|uniref:nuclear transport factor 2 family protein n=1 Tax=Sorangium sp. So ce385 TaxID=3133308 RepID=UPI003F5CA0DB